MGVSLFQALEACRSSCAESGRGKEPELVMCRMKNRTSDKRNCRTVNITAAPRKVLDSAILCGRQLVSCKSEKNQSNSAFMASIWKAVCAVISLLKNKTSVMPVLCTVVRQIPGKRAEINHMHLIEACGEEWRHGISVGIFDKQKLPSGMAIRILNLHAGIVSPDKNRVAGFRIRGN